MALQASANITIKKEFVTIIRIWNNKEILRMFTDQILPFGILKSAVIIEMMSRDILFMKRSYVAQYLFSK